MPAKYRNDLPSTISFVEGGRPDEMNVVLIKSASCKLEKHTLRSMFGVFVRRICMFFVVLDFFVVIPVFLGLMGSPSPP